MYETLTGKEPRQLQLPFALWTAREIAGVIKRELGITLSRWSVARLLRQLGLSPQKPLFRAWQQDPERVERWKKEEFPAIRKKFEGQGGVVLFLGESAVRSDHHAGTTWAPAGKTPRVKTTGARFSRNVIGAIGPKGTFRFMTFQGGMNAARFIAFLRRLLEDETRTVHLVVDRHPVYRSRAVKKFVEETHGKPKFHFLPPYSPERNPVEQVWNHTKNHQVEKQPITGPDQMKKLVLSALQRIQKLPESCGASSAIPTAPKSGPHEVRTIMHLSVSGRRCLTYIGTEGIRHHLTRQGTPIGPNDLLIAAHALSNDLAVVTTKVGKFSRVPGLKVENWLRTWPKKEFVLTAK